VIGGVFGNRNQAPPPPVPEAEPNEEDGGDAEDAGEAVDEDAEAAANNGVQDDNCNPIEWDRAAEELTWEKVWRISLLSLHCVFIALFSSASGIRWIFSVLGKFDPHKVLACFCQEISIREVSLLICLHH
jgi:hypothetical protein